MHTFSLTQCRHRRSNNSRMLDFAAWLNVQLFHIFLFNIFPRHPDTCVANYSISSIGNYGPCGLGIKTLNVYLKQWTKVSKINAFLLLAQAPFYICLCYRNRTCMCIIFIARIAEKRSFSARNVWPKWHCVCFPPYGFRIKTDHSQNKNGIELLMQLGSLARANACFASSLPAQYEYTIPLLKIFWISPWIINACRYLH